ncbi:MAG: hypothetical protein ABWK04_04875 [Hydrogenobacter sp.]|uniref:hypothetical protein n=1 Tax=Hydrogenobacter thermophilus TaxID=940 RepID=UPI0030FCCD12
MRKEGVREGAYAPYKLWQALRYALTLPILEKFFVRDFSPLKTLQVDWGRLAPVLGAGAMADPNTACRVLGLPEYGGIEIARHKLYDFV